MNALPNINLFYEYTVSPQKVRINLTELGERIENSAKEIGIEIKFNLREKLLSGRYSDAGYYVFYLASNEEMPGWFMMARYFELKIGGKHQNHIPCTNSNTYPLFFLK